MIEGMIDLTSTAHGDGTLSSDVATYTSICNISTCVTNPVSAIWAMLISMTSQLSFYATPGSTGLVPCLRADIIHRTLHQIIRIRLLALAVLAALTKVLLGPHSPVSEFFCDGKSACCLPGSTADVHTAILRRAQQCNQFLPSVLQNELAYP